MKLFGEKHESTADNYRDIAATQDEMKDYMKDYKAALQSKQRALAIRITFRYTEGWTIFYRFLPLGTCSP